MCSEETLTPGWVTGLAHALGSGRARIQGHSSAPLLGSFLHFVGSVEESRVPQMG